ncbi:MAG: hypothetical protein EB069_05455 [Actinobacteria bacterium]|nr:hypothetical protein [Actinomycetota bacterium]
MDRFWAGYAWLPAARGDVSCALLHSGRNSTAVLHTKLSACNHEIGQTEESKAVRCFWQARGGPVL